MWGLTNIIQKWGTNQYYTYLQSLSPITFACTANLILSLKRFNRILINLRAWIKTVTFYSEMFEVWKCSLWIYLQGSDHKYCQDYSHSAHESFIISKCNFEEWREETWSAVWFAMRTFHSKHSLQFLTLLYVQTFAFYVSFISLYNMISKLADKAMTIITSTITKNTQTGGTFGSPCKSLYRCGKLIREKKKKKIINV